MWKRATSPTLKKEEGLYPSVPSVGNSSSEEEQAPIRQEQPTAPPMHTTYRRSTTTFTPQGAPQPPVSPTIVVQETVTVPQGNCPSCKTGWIHEKADVVSIVCLGVLAVLTFPIGLVYLCCLPCAIEKRCSFCNRRFI